MGTGIASADRHEISQAAQEGRIETLFVSQVIDQADELAVNAVAVQTLQKRGEIMALTPDEMPTDQAMAATYRY